MADFYGTVEEADQYHADRGNAAWAAAAASPDTARIAALVRASGWIDGRYRDRFSGTRTEGRTQPLQWPRVDATDVDGEDIASDEVPVEIKSATFEAALRELASPGSLAPDFTRQGQTTMEKVGPITIQYAELYSAEDVQPCIRAIDHILAPLIGTHRPLLFGSSGRA